MSGSINKVILIGNLGRDPEARTMQTGGKVVNLSIAPLDPRDIIPDTHPALPMPWRPNGWHIATNRVLSYHLLLVPGMGAMDLRVSWDIDARAWYWVLTDKIRSPGHFPTPQEAAREGLFTARAALADALDLTDRLITGTGWQS